MGVAALLQREGRSTAFSFEVLPPLKGNGIDTLFAQIDKLREFNPLYINITNHRSECVYVENGCGYYERKSMRRRPGTVAVASAIRSHYDIPVVPHILCSGFSREDTEYLLLDLQFLGITDIFLLRGDKAKEESVFTPVKNGCTHALELIEQVNAFNAGHFVDGSPIKAPLTPFSYGVAGYPEKHEESPNMEQDLYWLKRKVDAGAEYVVTQMFFDNKKYFDFVERARRAGITVPIIPGIKPFSKLSQLSVVPKTFKVDLPEELVAEAVKCTDDSQARALGLEWCISQCRGLMAGGAPSIHFYTVGAVDNVREVAQAIY